MDVQVNQRVCFVSTTGLLVSYQDRSIIVNSISLVRMTSV